MAAAEKLKIGVLGSGSGSNAQSIIDAIAAGTLDAEVVCVLTDVEGAGILERAARHGISAQFISGAPFKTKLEGDAEQEYIRVLKDYGAECVVLAGFMRIVKPAMLAAFPNRVLNIHPALLPAFPGVASWKQALDYGTRVAGCTVHFVDEDTDTGPIIVQRCVPVAPDDTAETLHARIQIEEHKAYPEALSLLAADRLRIVGRRVEIL
jgi:phosphoribosylglycinamide formyltransferase-1